MDEYEFKKVPYRTVYLYTENGVPHLHFSTHYDPQVLQKEIDSLPPDRVWTLEEILEELQ